MTPLELRAYILTQMSAEDALLKMLEGSLMTYEKLKFPEPGKEVHPLILIANAAMDMEWSIAMEKHGDGSAEVRGLVVGTPEYMNSIFKKGIIDISKP